MGKIKEAATIGDNSSHAIAKDQLKSFVERVERLEEEKKTTADDIRDVYAEARGNGYDVKALRTIIKMRKQDADERAEQEAILSVYMEALGLLSDLPLGQAAIAAATRTRKPLESDIGKVLDAG